ncbi:MULTISPECIES: hypothetical protein [unclassified Arthrobacter]|uniref:hypothetical protein n=1 Tax=unclassified Arthrobacter TaxID=235627 RepID=UPI002103AE45|nr:MULTISPECIES: hypothetical protein [unclassified Arthrobacter]MCQ1945975.1 hypothetical protein [Arthrobacter sp. zg-Y1116]MCQ1985913.1 hypothetical protein [Arthrobacter sp. zg-Y844]MCQ1994345.1 hypothetical protein [Arthrobacter sp. zg-Y1171]UWX81564.1 hypothetical protein N2L00_14390 [Arthrobacter sp. zg-Y1171]
MRKDADQPVIPDGSEGDRAEQSLPAVPGAGDAGPEGEIHRDGSEADGIEQDIPAVPGAGDAGPEGEIHPDGSEADILEQKADVPGSDEDYPPGDG